ncbi:MAG: PAS domain S-box protein [Deltaproteobacteria bacterium]|nr:PAS domain S-box protein [Deltaproteobacteria bacterium]
MKSAEDIVKEKEKDFIVITADTTIFKALQLMVQNKTGAILVEEKDDIIGIWTERDLMRNILSDGFDPKTARVGDHMVAGKLKAPHTDTVDNLISRLRKINHRYLLIEKEGRYIGLLSPEDINKSDLLEKTKDYERLFEHVGSGVFISTKEGKFIDANPALLDMLGYTSKEEFLKIDIKKDLYLRPDDRRTFQEMIERDGQVIDYEVDFKRADGKVISILLTGHVRYDQNGNVIGYEGLNVDQSQRKKMEKEIMEAHDFLNNIINRSPNAIIAADMKGKIILWNRAAEETLKYSAKEVIGQMNIVKIYPEGVAQKIMQMMRSPEYGGVGKLNAYHLVTVQRDGGILEGNLSAAIIYNEKGEEIVSVGIYVDLKERLEMERRLRQTQEQLLQSEKLAAMGRLTSQIAHELNNPIYGIMNTLE